MLLLRQALVPMVVVFLFEVVQDRQDREDLLVFKEEMVMTVLW